MLAALNHANIAIDYELKEVNPSKYLVLELVEGDTLGERIATGHFPSMRLWILPHRSRTHSRWRTRNGSSSKRKREQSDVHDNCHVVRLGEFIGPV